MPEENRRVPLVRLSVRGPKKAGEARPLLLNPYFNKSASKKTESAGKSQPSG